MTRKNLKMTAKDPKSVQVISLMTEKIARYMYRCSLPIHNNDDDDDDNNNKGTML